MQIIQANGLENLKGLCTLYTEKDYQGETQVLYAGQYNREQIVLKTIGSIKLEENVKVTFYAESGCTGQSAYIDRDVNSGGFSFSSLRVEKIKGAADEGLIDEDLLDKVVGGVNLSEDTESDTAPCPANVCGTDNPEGRCPTFYNGPCAVLNQNPLCPEDYNVICEIDTCIKDQPFNAPCVINICPIIPF